MKTPQIFTIQVTLISTINSKYHINSLFTMRMQSFFHQKQLVAFNHVHKVFLQFIPYFITKKAQKKHAFNEIPLNWGILFRYGNGDHVRDGGDVYCNLKHKF